MNLLILTQKVNKDDPILGFFHRWIEEFSKRFQSVVVICLEEGAHDLPENVKVLSLGKESGRSKIKYIWRFYKYIWRERGEYETVFVHMNQEYVLLGWFFWKIAGKRIFLWRNFPSGNIFTRIAVWFSDRVFCTSSYSFTARFKKTRLMPVGIDTEKFKVVKAQSERKPNSILFLGRIAPIKRPDLLVDALNILDKKGARFVCDIYGDALPGDENYFSYLKEKVLNFGLDKKIIFHGSVPNYETPKIYNSYQIFVNLTPSGSMDKTILEAAACGCIPVVVNRSLEGDIDPLLIAGNSPQDVGGTLEKIMNLTHNELKIMGDNIRKYVEEKHNLPVLFAEISHKFRS